MDAFFIFVDARTSHRYTPDAICKALQLDLLTSLASLLQKKRAGDCVFARVNNEPAP
jgi:hypothetical protein